MCFELWRRERAARRVERRLPSTIIFGAILAVAGVHGTTAHADPSTSECIDANTKGQDARREHHFSTARKLLGQCSAASCPEIVRDDCIKRLDELVRAQPTIVFWVTDASGRDLVAVKVSVDGAVLTERVDGTALEVDPGAREFTFEVAGLPPIKQTLVVREGEKGRTEKVVLGAAPAADTAPLATRAAVAAKHASQLVVSSDETAAILIDGATVAKGRFDGPLAPGLHDVQVTEPGKSDYKAQVELRDGETRTLDVTLETAKRAPVWPWVVIGGAVVAGAAVGGYFLFRSPQEREPAPLEGSLGSVRFAP